MQTTWIYLNGSIIPTETARISPMDIGLLRGYAVFDLLRTYNKRPFLLAEHLNRLRTSAALLRLTVPASDGEIEAAIAELLDRNGHREATVRIVLTGGVSPDGMSFDPASPTFMILTHDLHEPPAEKYESGFSLVTCEHSRELAEAKTTNYLTMLTNRPLADEAGALDLLYCSEGVISEPATASFYIVVDGAIHAPSGRVLHGTTGALVLSLAREKYPVIVRDIRLEEVFSADEAFLTSTTRGVAPIVRVDNVAVGDGVPGPITRELMQLYREALSSGE